MASDVHLRPDRLRSHAVEAVDLAEGLQVPLGDRPVSDSPDLDRLATTLRRAVAELAELAAVLVAAADAAEQADVDVARDVRRLGGA